MSSSHLNRTAVRLAAGLGAVVAALGLVGAQLGLAHSYAGQAERPGVAASAQARIAAAQQVQERRAMR